MRSISVKLPSSKGLTMAATLDVPDSEPVAYALFAHCFTCNRFAPAASRISKALADRGVACLRFDFPGLGQSEGRFEDTSFSENVADLHAAYHWLEENYEAPQLAIGHSLGGAATLCAAVDMPAVRAVATVGAPFDPAHAVYQFADKIPEIDADGVLTMQLAGRPITMSREYLEDLADTNPETYIPKLRKPLLILHSPVDQTVGIESAQNIFRVARYPKSLVSLDRADHLMTRPGVAVRAAMIIREWADQYLVPSAPPAEPLEQGHAVAKTTAESKFFTSVQAGKESLISDREPSLGGGKGAGPTPTDLLMAAVSSAAAQAIRARAQSQRLRALEDVVVSARLESGALGAAVGTKEQGVSAPAGDASGRIVRSIALKGSLSPDEVQDLLASASENLIDPVIGYEIVDELEQN